jgi:hypothetical protein
VSRLPGQVLADNLVLPDPFDLTELCEAVGRRRGRPVILAAVPIAALGPCGLWLATDSVDFVCYERDTSLPHQQHIVLHELGHMLCGHGGQPVQHALGGLFPDLDERALQIMLARRHDTRSDADEREAELFAYAILARVRRRSAAGTAADDGDDDPLGRLRRVLEQ